MVTCKARRWRPRQFQAGVTLVELLIAVAVVALLAAIGVPAYLGFVQRARETAVIHYLAEVHKGQQAWRLKTDSLEFSGDFDELEESGFIPVVDNSPGGKNSQNGGNSQHGNNSQNGKNSQNDNNSQNAKNSQKEHNPKGKARSLQTTSSRVVQNYSLDLTAKDDPPTNTYAYSVVASPLDGSKTARWFYLDQTGVIRTGVGMAGPYSPPAL